MKQLSTSAALLGLVWGTGFAQVHPGYTISTVTFANNIFTSNSNQRPLVGDMAVFSDGRVAVAEWGVPSSVFILTGLPGASSGIGVTRFAKGLDNVMGITLVGNTIYVMEKEALTQLVDTDGNGVADEYNNVNQDFPSDNSMLNFPYDMEYIGGTFYSAMSSDVAVGGMDWNPSLAGRSTAYAMNTNGTSTTFACGFRNPNGMGVNGTDIFTSDNQGSWLPSSKVAHVRSGRFYGHQTNPANPCQTANSNTETRPVVWGKYQNTDGTGDLTGCSWGNPIVMQQGRFPGHMLVPDLCNNTSFNKIVRVFVEVVGGELQGVILPFIKNFTSDNNGVMRIKEAANGAVYLGHLGSTGGWGARSGMQPGLKVLRENTTNAFEVRAIRSLGSNSFEVEFSQPVGSNASQTNLYTVRQWQNVPQVGYGLGEQQNIQVLTVSSATVNSNRVTLQISGLQTGRVVKFDFGAITSQSGGSLFTDFAQYTLNRFGPGTDYQAQSTPVAPSHALETGWKLVSSNGFHLVQFVGGGYQPRSATLYDMKGAKVYQSPVTEASEIRLETGRLTKGMYFVRVSGRGLNVATRPLLVQ